MTDPRRICGACSWPLDSPCPSCPLARPTPPTPSSKPTTPTRAFGFGRILDGAPENRRARLDRLGRALADDVARLDDADNA
jgi:hypothetical protein